MNKIEKINEKTYKITCETGEIIFASTWYEKKTDAWHVKLPANNPTGRTYIRVDKIGPEGLEFETKTSGPREGLGWKARMTDDEKAKWAECEKTMAAIKEACIAREPIKLDPNSIEGLEALIAKAQAKLAALRG